MMTFTTSKISLAAIIRVRILDPFVIWSVLLFNSKIKRPNYGEYFNNYRRFRGLKEPILAAFAKKAQSQKIMIKVFHHHTDQTNFRVYTLVKVRLYHSTLTF